MNASLMPAPAELTSSTGKRQLNSTWLVARLAGQATCGRGCDEGFDAGWEQASMRRTRPASQGFKSALQGAVRLNLACDRDRRRAREGDPAQHHEAGADGNEPAGDGQPEGEHADGQYQRRVNVEAAAGRGEARRQVAQ